MVGSINRLLLILVEKHHGRQYSASRHHNETMELSQMWILSKISWRIQPWGVVAVKSYHSLIIFNIDTLDDKAVYAENGLHSSPW